MVISLGLPQAHLCAQTLTNFEWRGLGLFAYAANNYLWKTLNSHDREWGYKDGQSAMLSKSLQVCLE